MTVIRDVKIRVKTEFERARGDAPGSGGHDWGLPDDKAYYEQRDAINEAAKAEQEAVAITREHTAATREFGVHAVREYAHVGHGIIGLTRGMALLGAASEEDTRKLLEMLVAVEGLTAVAKGGLKIFTSLSVLLGGPVALAVTAVTVVALAGAVAWRKYAHAAEEAKRELRETRDAMEEGAKAARDFNREIARGKSEFGDERISDALTRESKTAALNKEFARQQKVIDHESAFAEQIRKSSGGKLSATDAQQLAGAEERRLDALKRQKDLLHQLADLEINATGSQFFSDLFSAFGSGNSSTARALDDQAEEARIRRIQERYEKSLSSLTDAMEDAAKKTHAANAGVL